MDRREAREYLMGLYKGFKQMTDYMNGAFVCRAWVSDTTLEALETAVDGLKTAKWDNYCRCTNCRYTDVMTPTYCSRCGAYMEGEE